MFKTAFSYTKQNFNKWPVIKTVDMDLYKLADSYKDKVPYVWFVNPAYTIKEDFNWNYRPTEDKQFNVHSFPRCFYKSKKPINWDVLKLVPTNPSTRINSVVDQRLISSFVDHEYSIYNYSFNDKFSIRKMLARSKDKQYRLIKSRKSLNDIFLNLNLDHIDDYVWLVDIDVEIDKKFYFDFIPDTTDTIYMFKLDHKSTNIVYGDYNVILVPKKYIESVQHNSSMEIKYKEVDVFAGCLDDMVDPKKAWERAFSTASLLLQNKFPTSDKKLKNKIMASYISNSTSRIHDYIKDACNCAVKQHDKTPITVDNLHNHQWLEEVFEDRQEFLRTEQSKLHPNRLDIIKRIYGENSDQYKTYAEKLKAIQPIG
jgi:hypothetical protein